MYKLFPENFSGLFYIASSAKICQASLKVVMLLCSGSSTPQNRQIRAGYVWFVESKIQVKIRFSC